MFWEFGLQDVNFCHISSSQCNALSRGKPYHFLAWPHKIDICSQGVFYLFEVELFCKSSLFSEIPKPFPRAREVSDKYPREPTGGLQKSIL